MRAMATPEALHVAWFGDRGVEVPLVVSVRSVIEQLAADRRLHVHVFQWQFSDGALHTLTGFAELRDGIEVHVQEFDPGQFAHLPGLHGDRMTYGRLLLPRLLPDVSRVLYLDADTVALLDVAEVFDTDLAGRDLGAIAWNQTVGTVNDSSTLLECGLPAESAYFNAGVLLLDLAALRAADRFDCLLERASELGERLINHDQTLLNLEFNGAFVELPWRYNVRQGADGTPYDGKGIVHFVGRGKPWSPAGLWLHPNARIWKRAAGLAGQSSLVLGGGGLADLVFWPQEALCRVLR